MTIYHYPPRITTCTYRHCHLCYKTTAIATAPTTTTNSRPTPSHNVPLSQSYAIPTRPPHTTPYRTFIRYSTRQLTIARHVDDLLFLLEPFFPSSARPAARRS